MFLFNVQVGMHLLPYPVPKRPSTLAKAVPFIPPLAYPIHPPGFDNTRNDKKDKFFVKLETKSIKNDAQVARMEPEEQNVGAWGLYPLKWRQA